MNDATLDSFRKIADTMRGDERADWQWIGAHMSQRMFGITEARAREYAARHGGAAQRMKPAKATAAAASIARDVLYVEDLETRGRDRLDFVEVSKANLERALVAAFEAGRAAR